MDKKKKYTIIKVNDEDFNKIKEGNFLYLYLGEYVNEETTAIISSQGKIIGKLDLDKALTKEKDLALKFSKEYDSGNLEKLNDSKNWNQVYILPISKVTTIKAFDLENIEVLKEKPYVAIKDQSLIDDLESKIKENYINFLEFEQEFKIICEEEDFYRLYDHYFPEKKPKIQVNHYFDKDFTLIEKGTVLRIREKEGSYVLTVKTKKNKDQELSTEVTEKLTRDQAQEILANKELKVEDYIENSIKGTYYLMGSLKTQRDQRVIDNIEVFFDKNTYFDQVDYEIEIEGKNQDLVDFFDSLDVEKDQSKMNVTKIQRFLREYKKPNK